MFSRTAAGNGRACSLFGAGNVASCKKSHDFQDNLLIEVPSGSFFAFVYGYGGKRIERRKFCDARRSKGMSRKALDFEESRKVSAELIERVADLQWEVGEYEDRIEKLESLLDSILICLNTHENGESQHSLHTIFAAIVHDIHLFRLEDRLTQFANS